MYHLTIPEQALKMVKDYLKAGYTQVELANKLKLPKTTINRWVRNRSKIRYRWAINVIERLDKLPK